MNDNIAYSVKDGSGTRIFSNRDDTTKPKMWVDVLFYKFDSTITLLEICGDSKEK